MGRVLVTGSAGLIGTALRWKLVSAGAGVLGLDLRDHADFKFDVREIASRTAELPSITGIVHFAAVSRVIDGERNPELCESVNVEGPRAVLEAASSLPSRPWVIYAPAFAAAAASGGRIDVEGSSNTLDFTHVDDVAGGVCLLIDLLNSPRAAPPPPIHFVSGQSTTLGELAALALELGEPGTEIVERPSRRFDVHNLRGDPSRVAAILGWKSATGLQSGFAKLVHDFKARGCSANTQVRGVMAKAPRG